MLSKSLTAVAASGLPGERGAFSADVPESARQVRRAATGKYKLGPRMAPGDTGAFHFGVASDASHGSRIVAIKRLHVQLARNLALAERFRHEAQIIARVRDPHVVRLLDLVESEGELWQVLEYVDGETLLALQTDATNWARQVPINVSVAILVGALRGLHAAHLARHENGLPLGVVHRAVTPRNIMIARSGQVKLIEFGSAKTTLKASSFDVAHLDDRVSYLSPEQVRRAPVDRRSDVFSAGVVLWEALTGRSLFGDGSATEAAILDDIEHQAIPAPSSVRPEIPRGLDQVVLIALRRETAHRFDSALEFARALEEALPPASASLVGSYVNVCCEARLARRQQLIRASETRSALEALGTTVNERPPPDDDEFEAVTLLAIPATASYPPLPPPDNASKSRVDRPQDRTLAWCFAAVVLVLFASIGWRLLRPELPTTWLLRSPARVTAAPRPAPLPASKPIASVPVAATALPQRVAVSELANGAAAQSSSAAMVPQKARVAAAPERSVPAGNTASPSTKSPSLARSSSSAGALDCTPPTYLGSDGIRHFKGNCL